MANISYLPGSQLQPIFAIKGIPQQTFNHLTLPVTSPVVNPPNLGASSTGPITVEQMMADSIILSAAGATAQTYTLPSANNILQGYKHNLSAGSCIRLNIINIGSTGAIIVSQAGSGQYNALTGAQSIVNNMTAGVQASHPLVLYWNAVSPFDPYYTINNCSQTGAYSIY